LGHLRSRDWEGRGGQKSGFFFSSRTTTKYHHQRKAKLVRSLLWEQKVQAKRGILRGCEGEPGETIGGTKDR